jgi:hypothetical protein
MKTKITFIFILTIISCYVQAQNIGINTPTPTNTLSVNGTVDITQKLGVGTSSPTGELHVMSSTSSTTVIDQQQPNFNTVTSGNNIWQSFTAGITGSLTHVALKVASPIGSNSSPGTINIYAGEGVSGILLSKIAVTYQPSSAEFQSFTLPNFVNVIAGNKYTIQLNAPSVTDYWILYQSNNPYAGGTISYNSDYDMPFQTTVLPATDALVVQNAKVGIGTTSPAAKLDIAGNVKITDGTQGTGKVLTSDANGLATWATPTGGGGFSAGTAAGNTPYWNGTLWVPNSSNIYNNGSFVGIGTTNPGAKLHVVGSLRIDGGLSFANGTEVAGHVLTSSANGLANWELPLLPSGGQTGNTPFWDGTRWNPNSNSIYNNGNLIGIGTTDPATKLHVVGSFKVDGPVVLADGTQGVGKVLTSDANGLASWATPTGGLSAGTATGNTPYWNGTTWVTNSSNIYNNGGNVGIGMINPAIKLDLDANQIIGTSKTFVTQHDVTNRGTKVSFGYHIPGNEFVGMKAIVKAGTVCGNSGDITLHTWECNTSSSREVMRINGTGNVGIGTDAPSAKLSVNGNANNTTGTWGVFSDARIKTVNSDFTDGLNVISKIHPVKYNYNTNAPFKADGEQIGIIAQELEKIAPYMVSKNEYADIKDLREVNNQAYVFLLINAVKELSVQNEKLNIQNEQFRAELELIKTKIGLEYQVENLRK